MTGDSGTPQSGSLQDATLLGVRWMTVARIAGEVLAFASMIVLARLIPPAAFGMFAVALVVQEIALTITGEGIGTALVQRPEVDHRHLRTALTLSVGTGLALGALSFVLAPLIFTPIFGPEVTHLVWLSTPLFVTGAITAVPQAVVQRRLDFRWVGIVQMGSVIARAGASLGLAIAGLDAPALVLGAVAANTATMAGMWFVAKLPRPGFHRTAASELLAFGIPAALSGISWTAFRNVDFSVVGARLGTTQAGFYWRAYQVGIEYQRKVGSAVHQVAFPVYSRAENAAHMMAVRRRVVRVVGATLIPVLVILAVTAPVAIPWLFGPNWKPTVVPSQILALAGVATVLSDTMGAVVLASGRPSSWLTYNFGSFLVYTGAVFAGSSVGLIAVCWSVLAVQVLGTAVAYVWLLHGLSPSRLADFWSDVAPAGLSSIVLAAVTLPLMSALSSAGVSAFPHLVVVGLAGALVYIASLRAFFPATWADFGLLVERAVLRRRPAPDVTRVSLSGASST
jgi:lipopolysaccharide exporter